MALSIFQHALRGAYTNNLKCPMAQCVVFRHTLQLCLATGDQGAIEALKTFNPDGSLDHRLDWDLKHGCSTILRRLTDDTPSKSTLVAVPVFYSSTRPITDVPETLTEYARTLHRQNNPYQDDEGNPADVELYLYPALFSRADLESVDIRKAFCLTDELFRHFEFDREIGVELKDLLSQRQPLNQRGLAGEDPMKMMFLLGICLTTALFPFDLLDPMSPDEQPPSDEFTDIIPLGRWAAHVTTHFNGVHGLPGVTALGYFPFFEGLRYSIQSEHRIRLGTLHDFCRGQFGVNFNPTITMEVNKEDGSLSYRFDHPDGTEIIRYSIRAEELATLGPGPIERTFTWLTEWCEYRKIPFGGIDCASRSSRDSSIAIRKR